MSEAKALLAPEAVRYHFKYDVAQAWIDDRIDQTGIEPSSLWQFDVNLVEDVGEVTTRRRFRQAAEAYKSLSGRPTLPEPTEDVFEFLQHLEAWIASHAGNHERELAVDFEYAMDAWIAEHGSPRLRRARQRKYKSTRLYASERARQELPGAWIDTAGTADLRERTDPSEDALDLEERVQARLGRFKIPLTARVMWVASPPRDAEEAEGAGLIDDFSEEEAVVVHGYLGRYRAIIAVDSEFRNPHGDEE